VTQDVTGLYFLCKKPIKLKKNAPKHRRIIREFGYSRSVSVVFPTGIFTKIPLLCGFPAQGFIVTKI
jgi:hypothetical protein